MVSLKRSDVTVCVCGGGSLGHVCAGFLAHREGVKVNVLTRRPSSWGDTMELNLPDGTAFESPLAKVSSDPAEVIPAADIVLVCLPGFSIEEMLSSIAPHVRPGTFVGSVFCSTGFFFTAHRYFRSDVPLWGFQRVPFISRTKEYGHKANLLGFKQSHNIAVENAKDPESFRALVEELFGSPVNLLKNYYEASFTNSNPILHPSRIYTLFKDWHPGVVYDRQFLFYEEWTDEASELLIRLDAELFSVLARLDVTEGFLKPILEYYESVDAPSLTRKIRSIGGFKGILSPMVQTAEGWIPDLASRYFTEDFPFGLRFIREKASELGVPVPMVDEIYRWYESLR